MAELALHFEMTPGTDLPQAAALLQERLASLPSVEEVAAAPERPRMTGLEIVAAITVAVTIVKGATELTEEVRKFIAEVARLMKDLKGLKGVTVEVGPNQVPIGDLTDPQTRQLAEE
jgi:hypothetical protein